MSNARYYIRSNLNGKWLSHLFEDKHDKLFQCPDTGREPLERDVYCYNVERVAIDIANRLDGTVVRFD